MQMTHIRILVNHYKECYQFYAQTLNFPCTWGDEHSNYAQFDVGHAFLSIFDKAQMLDGLGEQNHKNEWAMNEVAIIFRVEDVDHTYESLKDRIHFITDPHDRIDWGIRVVHFRDPNGTLIEMNQEL